MIDKLTSCILRKTIILSILAISTGAAIGILIEICCGLWAPIPK